jgi:hypothetical protein
LKAAAEICGSTFDNGALMFKTPVGDSFLYGIRYTDGSIFPCDIKGTVHAHDLGSFESPWHLVRAEMRSLTGDPTHKGLSILGRTCIYNGLSLLDLKNAGNSRLHLFSIYRDVTMFSANRRLPRRPSQRAAHQGVGERHQVESALSYLPGRHVLLVAS